MRLVPEGLCGYYRSQCIPVARVSAVFCSEDGVVLCNNGGERGTKRLAR